MDVQIRSAEPADLPQLRALAWTTYTDAYGHEMSSRAISKHLRTRLSLERLEEMLSQDVFLLAEAESVPVGFVQFGAARPEYRSDDRSVHSNGDDPEIRRLYVLAERQGLGLGGQLLTAALDHPRLLGSRRVFLTVWHTNLGAQRFYARSGFRRIGTFPVPTPAEGFDLLLLRDIRRP